MSVNYEQIANSLIHWAILEHPLPWRIEYDWTCEVIAADGYTIAKCKSHSDALEILQAAEVAGIQMTENRLDVEQIMKRFGCGDD